MHESPAEHPLARQAPVLIHRTGVPNHAYPRTNRIPATATTLGPGGRFHPRGSPLPASVVIANASQPLPILRFFRFQEEPAMAMLTVSGGSVPVGSYTGKFAGIEEVPANPEKKYAAGFRWKFVIDDGAYEGQTVSRITGPAPSVKNSCGKLLSGVIGRALKENEQIDPDTFVGKRYMLVVAAGQEGGTRVEAVIPMPESQS
jgi:hypothetical protein